MTPDAQVIDHAKRAQREARAALRLLRGVLDHHGVEMWSELPGTDRGDEAEVLSATVDEVRTVFKSLEGVIGR